MDIHRIRHACSALFRRMASSLLPWPLASWLTKDLISSDHLASPTNSGQVRSCLAIVSTTPSSLAVMAVPSQWRTDTRVVSMASSPSSEPVYYGLKSPSVPQPERAGLDLSRTCSWRHVHTTPGHSCHPSSARSDSGNLTNRSLLRNCRSTREADS